MKNATRWALLVGPYHFFHLYLVGKDDSLMWSVVLGNAKEFVKYRNQSNVCLFYLFTRKVRMTSYKSELCSHYQESSDRELAHSCAIFLFYPGGEI